MSFSKPCLICIVGPTAIGKTSLSIEVAKAFNTEILSADSRQFYKEMRIGTAVPSSEELAAVTHHFIQNKSIHADYNVGDFERDALQTLDKLFQIHPQVVMVGGSGLYVDAVVKGLDKFPDVPEGVRAQLEVESREKGIEYLQKELKELDPEYYQTVDLQNPHRLIRALEVCRASGKPFSQFRNKGGAARSFKTLYIGLEAEREVIYDRINRRVDIMMEEGLLEEAKQLFQYKDLNALQTVGYNELFEYFEGTISLEEAISEIKKNTRRFAKRQGTWYRKNQGIKWFPHTVDPNEVVGYIKEKSAQ